MDTWPVKRPVPHAAQSPTAFRLMIFFPQKPTIISLPIISIDQNFKRLELSMSFSCLSIQIVWLHNCHLFDLLLWYQVVSKSDWYLWFILLLEVFIPSEVYSDRDKKWRLPATKPEYWPYQQNTQLIHMLLRFHKVAAFLFK